MRTLVVTSRPPTSPVSGYDLRVRNLCRSTPGELHLAVVRHEVEEPGAPLDAASEVEGFASTHRIDDLLSGESDPRRHLRRSDDRFWRTSRPAGFSAATRRLAALVRDLDVAWIVVFGGDLAEVVAALGHPRTVLDVCDSVSLTRRRQLEITPPTGPRALVGSRLALARSRAHEARLPDRFRVVVTISEQDSAELRALAGPGARVDTVPNGVDGAFLSGMLPAGEANAVAFWGNLGFGPNQEALRWFLGDIHGPHLRDHGVAVRIVGPHAPDWLEELAAADPLVELCGFVPDLGEALAGVPVSVNAMRTGSGLKNKVLEAFGLGLVVVTTTRGIEAVAGARDGTHVAVADEAEQFAAVLRRVLADPAERDRLRAGAHALLTSQYRWSAVGARWRALFEG